MNLTLRVLLVVGALAAFAYMLRKIRKSEVKIADSTFWFLFGLSLVLLAVFPGIAYFFSDLLNFAAPVNFVYLYVTAVLLIREFITTAELSRVRSKLTFLTQEIALKQAEDEERERAAGASAETRGGARPAGGAACEPAADEGARIAAGAGEEHDPCKS